MTIFFLGVTDIEQGKKYYKDVLGLSLKFDFADRGKIVFNVGEQEPAVILNDFCKNPRRSTPPGARGPAR